MSLRLRRQLSSEGREVTAPGLTRMPSLSELSSSAMSRRSSIASVDDGPPSPALLSRTPSLAEIGKRFASPSPSPSRPDSRASESTSGDNDTTPKAGRIGNASTSLPSPTARRIVTSLSLPFGTMGQFNSTPPASPIRSQSRLSVPPTPAVTVDRFPLQHEWTFYTDSKIARSSRTVGEAAYQANLRAQGTFSTVEGFARLWQETLPPSRIEKDASMHLFKDGIKPAWEDGANAEGGRWIVSMPVRLPPAFFDESWLNLALATVGEQLDERDDLVGIAWQSRKSINRLQVWMRDRNGA